MDHQKLHQKHDKIQMSIVIHLKLNGGYNWLCKLGYHKGKIIRYVGTYFGLGGTTNGLIYKCERCQTEYTKLEQGVGGSYLCV